VPFAKTVRHPCFEHGADREPKDPAALPKNHRPHEDSQPVDLRLVARRDGVEVAHDQTEHWGAPLNASDLLLREVVARGRCLGGVGEEGLDVRATSGE
jgi:hypothetical protein